MPLLVRKKLVSADCACTGALARAAMAASAKHAGEIILAKLIIESLPVVFGSFVMNPSRRALFPPLRRLQPRKEKGAAEPAAAPHRQVWAISWSAGSPRVPSCRRGGGRRSRP